MFGVVPQAVWERISPPDELNRIRLQMNCLFIETPNEKIIIETGIGENGRKNKFRCMEFSAKNRLHKRSLKNRIWS